MTKECSKCHRVLPVGRFDRNRRTKDGLHGWCRSCNNARILGYLARKGGYAAPMVDGEPLTGPQYDEFFERVERICENPACDNAATALDHDHTTGEVRGVLCSNCNTAEGKAGGMDGLIGLVEYLAARQPR